MPVTKKKKNNSSGKKRIKKDIAEAAKIIPDLIVEHVDFENREEEPENTKETITAKRPTVAPPRFQKQKTAIAAIGVGVITLVVLFVWVINLKTSFYDFKFKPNEELSIWKETKSELENIISDTKKNLNSAVDESEIKSILGQLKEAAEKQKETAETTPENIEPETEGENISTTSTTITPAL